ncbi:TspO/MBR family protein [Brachyspira pilosicoli]|uniref:Integral membrane protein n=3 Tax=Brachyspira pilosicoli TaxID=52584 RepID=K0JGY2_BRAPL|nr:TspO/MBR family protein [Brachyspira pilosicoli]AFR69978.1 integral membrane protein [Brachyspira pilosicoli B2904]MBW5383270.1 tryptophan-rich sensory protein [Brachyspira pilosicoli]MBW5393068.1 tryptophan-rich sensory protein [Brachyspira pilosicoli]MBW5399313.1 tryptophan-rich sensory protein [Brachyspira pilosicoli]PLV64034.1 TspO and MBR [Brachyspira pilosicoli SP16]
MKKRYFIIPIITIAICLFMGYLAGISVKADNFSWYNSLNRSPLNPPNIIFPIAWSILYLLMGISIAIIINKYIDEQDLEIKKNIKNYIFLFIIQFILNLFWTYIFFGLKSPLFGFIEIIILDILIIITIMKFKTISKAASYILIPYILWCLFASYLTLHVLIFN